MSSKKYKSISVNVSPYNKNFLSANYNDEINNISKVSGVNINIFENIELHETQINIEEYKKNSTRAKKSKPVKKYMQQGSITINCDSPVWKNKPRCN